MSESSLSLEFTDFQSEVGDYLGYTTDSTSWSADQTTQINRYIQEGYRRVLQAHDWYFLTPIASIELWADSTATVSGSPAYADPSSTVTVTDATFYSTMIGHSITFDTSGTSYVIASVTSTTVAVVTGDASGETADDGISLTSDGDYRLPDDFGNLLGELVYSEDEDTYENLKRIGVEDILRRRWDSSTTGVPRWFAIEPLSSDATGGQRFDIKVYPTPDTNYTVKLRYVVLPNELDATYKYPYGGMRMSSVYLASVLAVAELKAENVVDGPMDVDFRRQLANAIYEDNMRRPDNLGPMGRGIRNLMFHPEYQPRPVIRYNGTTYSP